MIRVHVQGRVRHPGTYRLQVGTRGAEAIQAAGGPLADADLSALNLAAPLQDGQALLVPKPTPMPALPQPHKGSRRPTKREATAVESDLKVSLNQASLVQLTGLRGVGPGMARDILDYRKQHGAFHSIDELREVGGIGQRRLERLRPHLTL